VGALLLLSCGGQDRGDKVLLIGIDGADWKVMLPLLKEAKLPHIASLVEKGTSAWCRTFKPAKSPVVWTSIVTGVGPEKHGIVDFDVEVDPARGLVVPATSNVRKVKALWNILSEADMRVGMVGWWASWPAEEVNGFIISDHDVFDKDRLDKGPMVTFYFMDDEEGERVLKPRRVVQYDKEEIERLKEIEADTYPPSLREDLEDIYAKPEEIMPDDFRQVFHLEGEDLTSFQNAVRMDRRNLVSIAKFAYLQDSNRLRAALKFREEYRPNLLAVYLSGLDGVEHYAWKYLEPEGFKVTNEELRRYGQLIPNYYIFVDSMIGRLLDEVDKDTYVVVVSDHGHHAISPRLRDVTPSGKSGSHWNGPPGIFLMSGPQVRKDVVLRGVGILDVTPTILYLLDLPVGEDFDGNVLLDAFDEAYVRSHPVKKIPTYGGRETRSPVPSTADEEYFERLRALGYVE